MKQREETRFFVLLPEQKQIAFQQGMTVLEALIEAEVEIDHVCGGMGSCGTCHIFVHKGADKLGPRTEQEQDRAADLNFADNERLACQIEATINISIKLP